MYFHRCFFGALVLLGICGFTVTELGVHEDRVVDGVVFDWGGHDVPAGIHPADADGDV